MSDDVKSQLIFHLRPFHGLSLFPRRVTWLGGKYPLDLTVMNRLQYFEFVESHLSDSDVYVGVFSLEQMAVGVFDVVFIDVDDPSKYPRVEELVDDLPCPSTHWYSGRGYHVFLHGKPVQLNNYVAAVKSFLADYGFNGLFDDKVIRVNGLMRVPGTKNSKTGERMVFLGHRNGDMSFIADELIMRDAEEPLVDRGALEGSWDDLFPGCLLAAVKELVDTGELDHHQRLFMSNMLMRAGVPLEEVYRLFELYANDFKPWRTEYQLRDIQKRKLRFHSCQRLIDMGLCTGVCRYYPSLNRFVRRG